MSIIAIRGAITIDENNSNSILDGTKELIYEVEKRNNIDKNKVISIIFLQPRIWMLNILLRQLEN